MWNVFDIKRAACRGRASGGCAEFPSNSLVHAENGPSSSAVMQISVEGLSEVEQQRGKSSFLSPGMNFVFLFFATFLPHREDSRRFVSRARGYRTLTDSLMKTLLPLNDKIDLMSSNRLVSSILKAAVDGGEQAASC